MSDVEFIDISAVSFELKFAKTKYCEKLDGIIGSTLIKKAKWQIDYQKQVIRFSNDVSNLISEKPEFTLNTSLPLKGWGTETVELNIGGYVSQFNFDTGNGREKIVLHPSKLKEITVKNKESVMAYGFNKSTSDYKLIAETVTIGTIKFENQTISLQNEIGNFQLLGNRFFELFLVTMDWKKHQVYLNLVQENLSDKLIGFELDFKPNYESNTIEVATGLKAFTKKNKIEQGAKLLKVNETDVSNLSHQDLCDFWTLEWPQIMEAEKLNLVISQKGKLKNLIITKKEFI